MERTFSNVSGLENLYPIKDKIAVWDFEKLKGIGFYRGHDKYCYLEICVYEFNNHSDTERQGIFLGTYIDWKVDKEIFPVGMYELYKDELLKYADFIAASFSLLIGRQVNLIFEINFSGYHPTDNWSKGACGKALINAVVSCFDENIYKQGLGHRTNHYSESKLSEIKRLTVSMDKAFPAKPKK
jgi:hypothetical protein